MTLKDSADEMTFDLLEVPIVDKDIEGAVDNVTLDGNQYTDYLWLKKQFVQKWSILCDDEYTRLRGFYTRQFENADVPSYRLYYGDDIIRNSTLSGEYIQFSVEGIADGTMSLTQIDGNTIQDGTPTPSAPVQVQTVTGRQTVTAMGKNILDYVTFFRSGTYNGITASLNDDGSIRVSGVPTSNYVNIVPVHNVTDTLEDGATYSLSASGHDGMLIGQLQRRPKNGGSIQYIDTITGDKTVTINKSANEYYAGIMTVGTSAWGSGTTITRKFQLERGSVTSFEPFKGQGYEINLIGKNLLDVSLGYRYGYIQNSGQYADNNIIVLFNGFIPVEPSTTYTFSSNHTNRNMTAVLYADMNTYISRNLKDNVRVNTFTTPSNCHFVRLQVNYNDQPMNDQQVAGLELQLEKSSSATSYEAHHSIELCKIGTYQDRIYKDNGKWWLHKEIGKITFTSSTAWTKHSTTGGNIFMLSDTGFIGYPYNSGHIAQALMDTDEAIDLGTRPDSANGVFGINTGSQLRVFRGTYDASYTADTFKAEMVGHYIYGALATPTDTEITNEEVLEGLEALQDEAISVGQHNIYTDTPNALPTLTFDLTEYLSQSTTIIPETAVRLTLTDGGVINACGCRKDVQLTMRETIE